MNSLASNIRAALCRPCTADLLKRFAPCDQDRKGRHARSKTKHPGIGRDARELGISRMQLWAVLTGQRESPTLRARYAALKKAA